MVKAGDGGDGAIAFRREKFVPYGGPSGGDGGNGGAIVLVASAEVSSLRGYRGRRTYRAEDGKDGQGSRKHGRDGSDLLLSVPEGTIVYARTGDGGTEYLGELGRSGTRLLVARGGRGGWGNARYASPTYQTPRIAQRGEKGEEKQLLLEMRLIADVGIVGFPNVGKSTLLAAASAARPKIASYPFTTLEPVLGVVTVGDEQFVMAEIPGLVEGSSKGKGLGHDFLRHAMRTRLLIHLVDGTAPDPLESISQINAELALFDPALAKKQQIVAVNKIDVAEVREKIGKMRKALASAGVRAHFISAASGEGVGTLMAEALKILKESSSAGDTGTTPPRKIFRPVPVDARVSVSRQDDEFVVGAPGLERLIVAKGVGTEELRWHIERQLTAMGLNKALEKAGARPGDRIRCGEVTWIWTPTKGKK